MLKKLIYWRKLSLNFTEKFGPENMHKEDQSIGRYVYPLLSILRFVGLLPFSSYVSQNGNLHYYWKWNSWPTAYTVVLDIFLLSGILLGSYLFRLSSAKALWFADTSSSSTIERTAINLIPIMHTLMATAYIISGLASTRSVLRLFEKWRTFETTFASTFSTTRPIFAKHFMKSRRGGFAGSIMVIVTTIPLHQQMRQNYCKHETSQPDDYSHIFCTIGTLVPVANLVFAFFEDSKAIFMIRTVSAALVVIQEDVKEWCEGHRSVGLKQVREWQRIIFLLRKQAKSTADSIAAQHIFNLFMFFVVFCLSLFLTILLVRGDLHEASKNTATSAMSLSVIGFFRLFAKAVFAESIVSEEKALANYLRLIGGTDKGDLMTRLEISTLVSVMDKKPTRLDLNGLFVLNFSLLAQIFTTVVTYLVVLFQFNDLH